MTSSFFTQIGSDIDGEAAHDQSGFSVSLSSDGSVVAIGAPFNDDISHRSGHVRIYKNVNDTWTQVGSDIDGEGHVDDLGYSVSLSSDGSVVAIGAPEGDGYSNGLVRIYKNINNTWTKVGADINGEASDDNFGTSVSLSSDGSVVAIGAPEADGYSNGYVRIYKNINDTWTQLGSDIDGEASGDYFGISVSLSSDGSVVAIGASENNDNGRLSGHVRIYKSINDTWTQVGSDIDGEAAYDYSGTSVSLSSDGSVVAIGAYGNTGNNHSGHVRIYKNVNDTWTQVGSDIDGEFSSGYSVSLSADGSLVAIGAPFNGSLHHIRIYKYINNLWIKVGADIDGEDYGDQSGKSVSLSADGSTVAIGAPFNEANGTNSGHTRVYQIDLDNLDTTAPSAPISLTATTTRTNDNTPIITGIAEAGSTVKLYNGSILLGSATAGTDGAFSITTSALNYATYSLTATATDATGNTSPLSSVLSIEVNQIVDSGNASFSIVGTKSVGNYLSIKRDSQDPDGTGKLSYQWQSSSDGSTWSNVSTNSTYRLKYTDSDKYYKATISYTDDDGFSESITTDTFQIDKHSIHTSLESLKSQLSNLTYSTSFDYTSLGYSEEFGSSGGETLYAGENEIVWGLAGDDSLKTSYSYNFYDHYLIGGSGNDTYTIRGDVVAIIYEAPNHGNNDSLYLSSNYYYYGFAASIDNKHLFAIYDDQVVFVIDAWENKGIENIYLGNLAFSSSYFLNLLPSLPGYLGNVSWDEIKPYTGDLTVNTVKNVINEIKSSTTTVESDFESLQSSLNSQISSLESQASDLNRSTEEVLFINQSVGTSYHLTAIRDYDGNFHANTGSVSDATKTSYKYQGLIDVNADGIEEAIYTNKESGRWVTASINSSTGEIDYSDHGSDGTTRVVGIYEDPLVASGDVISGSDHDSQRRFQNDLYIDNLIVKTSGDFDSDGDQEVYWKTTDGTAYLRALMHADGNIQYANYQSEEQMSEYLTAQGHEGVIAEII